MPEHNKDLHGSAPDQFSLVLLLIDVINDLEFIGGEELLPHALSAARNITTLKKRAKQAGIPCIYVNDNFGKWQSNFKVLLTHCLQDSVRGSSLAKLLSPEADDYFVLKPKHSGFYSTSLDILLRYLEARTLILTGLTTDICVLFTANDAYMRDYQLIVPADCVAAIDPAAHQHALQQIQRVLKADITMSSELDLTPERITATQSTPPQIR